MRWIALIAVIGLCGCSHSSTLSVKVACLTPMPLQVEFNLKTEPTKLVAAPQQDL